VKVKRGEEISGLNTPPLKMIRGEEVFPPEIGLTIPPSLLARTDQVIDATAVSAPLGPRAALGSARSRQPSGAIRHGRK
jgi:hypothetical protein